MNEKSLKVGDTVVSVFSYNMTFVKFYEVVGMTKSGKSVDLVRLNNVEVSPEGSNGFYGTATPCTSYHRNNESFRTLTRKARKWDGTPMYFNSLD